MDLFDFLFPERRVHGTIGFSLHVEWDDPCLFFGIRSFSSGWLLPMNFVFGIFFLRVRGGARMSLSIFERT